MIDPSAYEAQERYAVMISAWRSMLRSALASKDPTAPRIQREMISDATKLSLGTFLVAERDIIDKEMSRIEKQALRELSRDLDETQREEFKELLREHRDASVMHLRAEIETMVRLDLLSLRKSFNERVTEARRRARARSISIRQALIESELTLPVIGRRDSAGRMFSSDIVTRNAWRLAMIGFINESVLHLAALRGIGSVDVKKKTPEGIKTLANISIDGVSKGETYDFIRRKFFHPNSNAYLEVPNVPS